MTDEDVLPPTCAVCAGIGWVLGADPTRNPLVVDLLPCAGDDCTSSGRPIEVLAVHGMFAKAVLHGATRAVMSLTGGRPGLDTAVPPSRPPTGTNHPATVPPRNPLPPGARPTGPTTS